MNPYFTLGARDAAEAAQFYDAVLATIGWSSHASFGTWRGYSRGGSGEGVVFWSCTPFDGGPASSGNGAMVGFPARSKAEVDNFHAAALAKGTPVHVGGIFSSDTFYDERPDLTAELKRHGCLGVEMEAAELYMLAARHGARALVVLTVSDHITTGEALPADQRERSFGAMIEIALAAAFA